VGDDDGMLGDDHGPDPVEEQNSPTFPDRVRAVRNTLLQWLGRIENNPRECEPALVATENFVDELRNLIPIEVPVQPEHVGEVRGGRNTKPGKQTNRRNRPFWEGDTARRPARKRQQDAMDVNADETKEGEQEAGPRKKRRLSGPLSPGILVAFVKIPTTSA
jgi:hypothetical protein